MKSIRLKFSGRIGNIIRNSFMRTATPLSGLVLFACSVFVALLLSGCNSEPQEAQSGGQNVVRPAKLVEVGLADDGAFLNYPAVIRSQQYSVLSFEVGGVIAELMVQEAQRVSKGEVLAKLDQRDLLAQQQTALAQFESADAEYQRAERLIKEDAISRSELEQRKAQRDVTGFQLETAQKALDDATLVAPYAGAVARVLVEDRQNIQPGETIINLLGSSGLEATVDLPSGVIARAGRDGRAQSEAYIVLDAAPDRRLAATFKEISLEADAASQTYEVSFAFAPPSDLNVLPGMNAIVWLADPTRAGVGADLISVPLTAVVSDGEQNYVWVVEPDSMTVSRRNIVVDAGVGASLGVISGLEAGETIVSAGVTALSAGMQVSAWTP